MIQIDERDLQIVLGLAMRALKYPAEARLLELLAAQWNAQQAQIEAEKKAQEKKHDD